MGCIYSYNVTLLFGCEGGRRVFDLGAFVLGASVWGLLSGALVWGLMSGGGLMSYTITFQANIIRLKRITYVHSLNV